jgi:hypothetical protein
MSDVLEKSVPTGYQLANPDTPNAILVRRLSVYFSSGEGQVFDLAPGDQLVDPLIAPPDARPDWKPAKIDIDIPTWVIVRAVADPEHMQNQEVIYRKYVAWHRWMSYWAVATIARPASPSSPGSPIQPRGPQFRDQHRPRVTEKKAPIGDKPVVLPPES